MKVQDDPRFPLNPNPSKDWLDQFVRQLTHIWRDMATQVNGLSEGQVTAKYSAMSAIPTTGTYKSGDYVPKSTYAIEGVAGSRYVVKGWNRITNGSAHVLNTDWTEDRASTGN